MNRPPCRLIKQTPTLIDKLPIVLQVVHSCRKWKKFPFFFSTKIHEHIIEQWLRMRVHQLCHEKITLQANTQHGNMTLQKITIKTVSDRDLKEETRTLCWYEVPKLNAAACLAVESPQS